MLGVKIHGERTFLYWIGVLLFLVVVVIWDRHEYIPKHLYAVLTNTVSSGTYNARVCVGVRNTYYVWMIAFVYKCQVLPACRIFLSKVNRICGVPAIFVTNFRSWFDNNSKIRNECTVCKWVSVIPKFIMQHQSHIHTSVYCLHRIYFSL